MRTVSSRCCWTHCQTNTWESYPGGVGPNRILARHRPGGGRALALCWPGAVGCWSGAGQATGSCRAGPARGPTGPLRLCRSPVTGHRSPSCRPRCRGSLPVPAWSRGAATAWGAVMMPPASSGKQWSSSCRARRWPRRRWLRRRWLLRRVDGPPVNCVGTVVPGNHDRVARVGAQGIPSRWWVGESRRPAVAQGSPVRRGADMTGRSWRGRRQRVIRHKLTPLIRAVRRAYVGTSPTEARRPREQCVTGLPGPAANQPRDSGHAKVLPRGHHHKSLEIPLARKGYRP